jgi:ATP-binding cassette subfamily B protein
MQSKTTVRSGIQFVWASLTHQTRYGLLAALALTAAAAWMNAMIPVLLGDLASSAEKSVRNLSKAGPGDALSWLVILGFCFLGRELAQMARKYLVHRITTASERGAVKRMVGHLLRLDLATLKNFQSGAIQGRIRRCLDGYVRLLKLSFMDFIPAIMTAGFAIAVAIARHVEIGGLILLSLPFLFLAVGWQGRSQKGIRVALVRNKERMEGTVAEQLAGIEYIRTADTHRLEEDRIAHAAEVLRATEMRHHSAMGWFDFLKAMIESAFFIAVIWVAFRLAGQGRIPVGEIITSTMLFTSVLGPVREIHRIMDEAAESSIAVSDFGDLMRLPHDASFEATGHVHGICTEACTAISAQNLTVKFPHQGMAPVLENFNVVIPRGQIVGIVGKTGCGKSTFLKTLTRLVHPTSGELKILGRDIGNLSRTCIGEIFGVVSQIPFIKSGTIRDNIAYGHSTTCESALANVVEMAVLAEDIKIMKNGLDAAVLEAGSNFSGGQRQRIAIARALLNPKPITIFDEATSALDNVSEARVLDSILQLRGRSTVMIIAHRLSTLRYVDRILVFSEGKIVEDGTYDQLLAQGGHFATSVKAAASQ